MTEEEDKLAEEAAAAEAETKAKAEEEAKAAEALLQEQEIDYKTLAEANAVALAAAEALIIKNKNIAKRQEGGETTTLTKEDVLALIAQAKAGEDDSPEAKALAEAQRNLKIIQGKNAEIARALKNKATPQRDVAGTQRDGETIADPKLPEGSPLKSYKHEGGGIYSKKLASGKTLYMNTKAGVGEQKKWVK